VNVPWTDIRAVKAVFVVAQAQEGGWIGGQLRRSCL
jgi:hypothetical protein